MVQSNQNLFAIHIVYFISVIKRITHIDIEESGELINLIYRLLLCNEMKLEGYGPNGEKVLKDGELCTKHIFVGTSRITSKLTHPELGEIDNDYAEQNTYYYHQDHLGSSNFVSDYQGNQYEFLLYLPYGETWVEESKDILNKINYYFTSQEKDEETGLYYMKARYFEPQTSRWMSADPIFDGLKDGFSVYGYCHNNPLKYYDPTGLYKVKAGDEMWKVARDHKTTLKDIQKLNPGVDLGKIDAGQNIKLPGEGFHLNIKFNINIDFNKRLKGAKEFFGKAGRFMERGNLSQGSNDNKYGQDCFKFATVYAMLLSGKGPKNPFWRNFIANMSHEQGYMVKDILKNIFGFTKGDAIDIPAGLSESELNAFIGNNPAVLYYTQDDFWGNGSSGNHAIGYYKGKFGEPYIGLSGSFNKVKGGGNASITDYTGGYYITW